MLRRDTVPGPVGLPGTGFLLALCDRSFLSFGQSPHKRARNTWEELSLDPRALCLCHSLLSRTLSRELCPRWSPWLPVSPWLRESAGLFPASPSLCCGQENLSKKKSWDNCKAYFVCFLFLGITFLCHLISSFLETIISYFLFLCVRKVSTLLLYLGWKSECHIWINFCELFWILRAED